MLRTSTFSETSFICAMMAGGVLCLEFSGSIFGIFVLKTLSGILPFLSLQLCEFI